MKLHFAVILAIMIFSIPASAKKLKSTRTGLTTELRMQNPVATPDTLRHITDSICLTGYEKAQNSRVESVFVTNNSDRHILSVCFVIDYFDMKGRQLHRAAVTCKADIPPHQTRMVDFKSWDRQQLWHYINTRSRHNDSSTPFDARIHIDYVVADRLK